MYFAIYFSLFLIVSNIFIFALLLRVLFIVMRLLANAAGLFSYYLRLLLFNTKNFSVYTSNADL